MSGASIKENWIVYQLSDDISISDLAYPEPFTTNAEDFYVCEGKNRVKLTFLSKELLVGKWRDLGTPDDTKKDDMKWSQIQIIVSDCSHDGDYVKIHIEKIGNVN